MLKQKKRLTRFERDIRLSVSRTFQNPSATYFRFSKESKVASTMRLGILILCAVSVHMVCFVAIFDIFFSTPMYNGMTPHVSRVKPPAKRLVFIIADGLRADKIFELDSEGKTPAPFLRNIMETKGAWGISHARPPTATRPGHVALTAGFYEDPTSVAKDIQGKPVVFDTIFNESQYTFSWDTPKFLQKITRGNPNRMYSKYFPGEQKYLAGIDAREMDSWVFDEVKTFLEQAKTDSSLLSRVNEDRVLFFLHLGGLDHNGYIVRPSSDVYKRHVSLVDMKCEHLIHDIEDFFHNDGRTAYVFTSDHGMTEWGGHGDGSQEETFTPLIAWGPGVRHSQPEVHKFADGLSEAWKLEEIRRTDINQGSVAPLIASLVGIPYPMNAVYAVPHQLLNMTSHDLAEVLYADLLQLLDLYKASMQDRQSRALRLTYQEFGSLSLENMASVEKSIQTALNSKDYDKAVTLIKAAIDLTLEGLKFYRNYDRALLWPSIAFSFVGWMAYLVTVIMEGQLIGVSTKGKLPSSNPADSVQGRFIIIGAFSLAAVITFILLYVQSTELFHYFYILMLFPIWLAVALRFRFLQEAWLYLSGQKHLLGSLLVTFVGLVILVISFYQKEVLCIISFVLAVWPWFARMDHVEKRVQVQWFLSCITVAIFVLMPRTDRALNFNVVLFSGILALFVCAILVKKCVAKSLTKRKLVLSFGLQLVLIAIATIIAKSTAALAEANGRTPLLNQILSWVCLVGGLFSPLLMTTDLRCRLLSVAMGILAPYILFSVALFMLAMCWNLFSYICLEVSFNNAAMPTELPTQNGVENGINGRSSPRRGVENGRWLENMDLASLISQADSNKTRQYLSLHDLRRAFYPLFMAMFSLFGGGHIASVNSFDAASIYCFLTVSHPPSMGVLMVLKIMMPMFVIWCAVRALNLSLQIPQVSYAALGMLMADIVALSYFALVTDEGSDEKVGKTVGHYIIYMATNLTLMLMYFWSACATSGTLCCSRKYHSNYTVSPVTLLHNGTNKTSH